MLFKKILCPTDFSEASIKGLHKAVEAATTTEAEICVIHVEAPAPARTPIDGIAPFAHNEAERRADTVANLCAVLADNIPASVRARPLLKSGDATTEILRAAREEGVDLIVLTTHGAGGSGAQQLGRVAEAILQAAPCMVLSIKAPTGEAVTERNGARPDAHSYDGMPAQLEIVSSKAIFLDGD